MTNGEALAEELQRAVRGDAWHGPALNEVIAGVSAEEAMQRPIPAAHNIWELVLHITSWANIVMRRLSGGQSHPYEGEDWPAVHDFSPEQWSAATDSMSRSYEHLCALVAGMSDEQLLKEAPNGGTIEFMLHGSAQHAAYHGGQISLLRKAVTTKHRRAAI